MSCFGAESVHQLRSQKSPTCCKDCFISCTSFRAPAFDDITISLCLLGKLITCVSTHSPCHPFQECLTRRSSAQRCLVRAQAIHSTFQPGFFHCIVVRGRRPGSVKHHLRQPVAAQRWAATPCPSPMHQLRPRCRVARLRPRSCALICQSWPAVPASAGSALRQAQKGDCQKSFSM